MFLTLNIIIEKEPSSKFVQDLLAKDAYLNEYLYASEDVRKMKRDTEYKSWVMSNEAAINIQKVFKGVLEKDYLLKFLENKYQKDMVEPSLKL